MLSLSSPLWLFGLALVPLIRWLHRFHDEQDSLAVPALFLWRGQLRSEAAGPRPDRPDPRWRLRALLVTMLVLALAGPRWSSGPGRAIHVWVDDSLSMFSVEQGESRLQDGLRQLVKALQEVGPARVTLHSLGNPARRLQLEAQHADERLAALSTWARTPQDRLRPPAAIDMDSEAEHWLISDGADEAVQAWVNQVALHRIIQVGTGTENVALTDFAARPALGENTPATVMIRVRNLGQYPQQRTLVLESDTEILQQWDLPLAAGASLTREFPLPDTADTRLHARLSAGDVLAQDDVLHLELHRLAPIRVGLAGRCGRHLLRALRTHPRLAVENESNAMQELSIRCTEQAHSTPGPAIHIHTPRKPQAVSAPAHWNTDLDTASWPHLDPAWLYSDAPESGTKGQQVLLGTSHRTLITLRDATPRQLDVFLDLENEQLVRQPEYPALIDTLIGYVLRRPVLDETVRSEREAIQSFIAPQTLQAANAAPATATTKGPGLPLSAYFIGVGILLLLVDLLRARAPATARAAVVKPA